MIGAVFTETLKRTWLQMLYWGIGLGAMGVLVVLFVPLFDSMDLVGLMEDLPDFMMGMLGISDKAILATPEGIIAVGFFGKMGFLFAVYPAVMGLRVTTSEEYDGTLDVLLSLPISRWQMILEKFAAYTLTVVMVVFLMFAGLWLGTLFIEEQIDMGRLAEAVFATFPLLAMILAFTVFVGALLSRRTWVLSIVTVFIIASFTLQAIGVMGQGSFLGDLATTFSVFSYADGSKVLLNGIGWGDFALLVALAAALLYGSVWVFQRRDVGV
jgi:ABC-2 type transport system permease protein